MKLSFPPILLSAMLAAVSGCRSETHSVTTQASTQTAAGAWYEPEIRTFEASDKLSPPRHGQVLFIGSSSIRKWSTLTADMQPLPVLNRGFGGSKTADALAVFDRIVRPYEPAVIVYYCGDNDLGKDNTNSQAAAEGFLAFHRRAAAIWPDIRVFYIAIKPSIARWSNWSAMKRANNIVRRYCESTRGLTYIDVVPPMLGADGSPDPSLFREDGLHMTEKGYAIWTDLIRSKLLEAWSARKQ
jgi:lysophospholipase L1-like esterase